MLDSPAAFDLHSNVNRLYSLIPATHVLLAQNKTPYVLTTLECTLHRITPAYALAARQKLGIYLQCMVVDDRTLLCFAF